MPDIVAYRCDAARIYRFLLAISLGALADTRRGPGITATPTARQQADFPT